MSDYNLEDFIINIGCEDCGQRKDEMVTYRDLANSVRFYCVDCLGITDEGKPKFGAIPVSEAIEKIREATYEQYSDEGE